MLHQPKTPAPEPYASAALWLLYQVALYIRFNSASIKPEQLHDLADAIHNIPQSLTEYSDFFDEQTIRDHFLAAYDAKWACSPGDFSLLGLLDAGIDQVRTWLQQ